MNRILKRLASDEIEVINSNAVLTIKEKINFKDIQDGVTYKKIQNNLKKLEKYQDKESFLNTANDTFTDVVLLKSQVDQLYKSLSRLLMV